MNISEAINKVCDNLNTQKDAHKGIAVEIMINNGGFCRFHTYILSMIKRSMDIIDTFIYSTSTYNLNTQIPLMRLQMDNCITLYGIILLKDTTDVLSSILSNNHRWYKYNHPTTKQKLSESYIAQEIDKKHSGFYGMYKFCCQFVHFSKSAINTTIHAEKNYNLKGNVMLGNPDMPNDVITNANSMIMVTKVLFMLIENAISLNEDAEVLSKL